MLPTFDPMSPEFLADPDSIFAPHRAVAAVHRHENAWPAPVASILSHSAVKAGFRDWETFSSFVPEEARELELLDAISMAGEDPPVHTRLRAAVSSFFTGRSIMALEPAIREIADALFDDAIEQGEIDMVEGLAAKIESESSAG